MERNLSGLSTWELAEQGACYFKSCTGIFHVPQLLTCGFIMLSLTENSSLMQVSIHGACTGL